MPRKKAKQVKIIAVCPFFELEKTVNESVSIAELKRINDNFIYMSKRKGTLEINEKYNIPNKPNEAHLSVEIVHV